MVPLLEWRRFLDMSGDSIMQDDIQTSDDENGKADAFAAVYLISIVVVTVIFWLTNQ